MRTVTFAGAGSVVVPPGTDLVGDPVRLRIPADANLLISVHTPADSGPATYHRSAHQTNFLAREGDRTTDERGTRYTVGLDNWFYVTGVDVLGAPAAGSVVTLGDSITDGTGSTPDTNHRWPDRLAARLRDLPRTAGSVSSTRGSPETGCCSRAAVPAPWTGSTPTCSPAPGCAR